MKTNRALHLGWIAFLAVPAACSHQQPPSAQQPQAALAAPSPAKPAPKLSSADSAKTDTRPNAPTAVFFEFDSALLKPDARDALAKTANQITTLRRASHVTVEGNCDDLGTVEYNLALGEQRAESAKQYLVHMGVDPQRIKTTSYGSQRPRYPGHDEVSRAKNRRDDVIYQ